MIFGVVLLISFSIYKGTDTDYIIEKGHIASEKINQISHGNLFPTVSSSTYDEIVQKRNMCIVGMVIGALGAIISLLAGFIKRDEVKTTNDMSFENVPEQHIKVDIIRTPTYVNTNLTNEQRLKDLKELLDKGYVSQEEYQEKRDEIIKSL